MWINREGYAKLSSMQIAKYRDEIQIWELFYLANNFVFLCLSEIYTALPNSTACLED